MELDKLIKNMIFYIIIFIVTLSIYYVDGINSNSKVLISNMIIITFSLVFMVIGDRNNYSLNKIFMLFSFFFFGIAPAIQYQKGVVLWSYRYFSDDNYFKMNILIISLLVIYQLLYFLFSNTKNTKLERKIITWSNSYKRISHRKLLLVSLFSFLITMYVYNFSIANLIIRGGKTLITNQPLSLLYTNFIRPMPAICLFIFKTNNKKKINTEIVLWIIMLITNFPTGAARFYVASLYIPILIIYIKRINKSYLLFNKILMVGFMIIFPFLDQVRRITSLTELTFSLDFRMFSQGHFDSYQMFMYAVVDNIITYGKQLVSALLFFVPRSIWPGKSVGSGYLVANYNNFYFSNVSMNYFGEGFINFGYLGVLLFAIIIAYLNARFDKMFWLELDKGSLLDVFYLQNLGLQFFYLRGDMLSGTSFVVGMFICLLFTYTVVSKKD